MWRVACCLVLGCGSSGPTAISADEARAALQRPCPDGTAPMREETGGVVRAWCQDTGGLRHGPFVELERPACSERTETRGGFRRGQRDGALCFRDDRISDRNASASTPTPSSRASRT